MGLVSVPWTFSDNNCLVFNLSDQFKKKKKTLKIKPPINQLLPFPFSQLFGKQCRLF